MRKQSLANTLLIAVSAGAIYLVYWQWHTRHQAVSPDVVQRVSEDFTVVDGKRLDLEDPREAVTRQSVLLSTHILGRVYDDTFRSIAGAQVRVFTVDANPNATDAELQSGVNTTQQLSEAITDSSGRFDLGPYPRDDKRPVVVYCSRQGYSERTVRARQGQETGVLLSSSWRRVELVGSVMDDAGNPTSNFAIQLQRRNNRTYSTMPGIQVSAPDGHFDVFTDIPDRFFPECFAVATAPGFQSSTLGPLKFESSGIAKDLGFVLGKPTGSVTGYVFSEQGDAISGADISMIVADGRSIAHGEAAQDGSFSLSLFSVEERATIYVEKPGKSPEWIDWNPKATGAIEIIVVLRDAARLSVQLRDPMGESVANKAVVAWVSRRPGATYLMLPDYYSEQSSDERGRVVFSGVPYGTVNIAVIQEYGTGRNATNSIRQAANLVVTGLDNQADVVIPHGYSITGKLESSQFKADAVLWVSLVKDGSQLVASMRSTNSGMFSLHAIPSGTYDLGVAANDHASCHFKITIREQDELLGTLQCEFGVPHGK